MDSDEGQNDSDGSQSDEYGVDDEELFVPGDDDDHDEMGELGSDEDGQNSEDKGIFDPEEDEEFEGDEMGSDDNDSEGDEDGEDSSKDAPSSSAAPAPAAGRYIPPHRAAAAAAAASSTSSATPSSGPEAPPEDPRLRRQINGHLNKLSSSNMSAILAALEALYSSNPRAIVSATLTSVLIDNISGRDNLGEVLIITYAALVAAVSRSVGVEFPAGVISKAVMVFDEARAKNQEAKGKADDGGFEGRPGSKECENLVAFLAELYNFQVVACVLVYDLIREFIDSGLEELEVELLVKIVKRAFSSPFFPSRAPPPNASRDLPRCRTTTSTGRSQRAQGDHHLGQAEGSNHGSDLDEVRLLSCLFSFVSC